VPREFPQRLICLATAQKQIARRLAAGVGAEQVGALLTALGNADTALQAAPDAG
jgi:hypothetical protein